MIFDKLSPLYFTLAFIIGLILCFFKEPNKKIVLKFPSPTNAGRVIYKDKAGQCYKYQADKLETCPNTPNVKPQPVLEDYRNKKFD